MMIYLFKNKRTMYDKFPKQNKTPKKGDIWIAKFPYDIKGGMEKVRPVYVISEENDKYYCQSFTTNKNRGKEVNKNVAKLFDSKTYLTNNKAKLSIDKFYKRLCSNKEIKDIVLEDKC